MQLSISLPRNRFTDESLNSLRSFIKTNEKLIKLATGSDDLSIEIDKEKVTFPWFDLESNYNVNDCQEVVIGICKSASLNM